MRLKMRAIRVISTKSRSGGQLEIKEAYTKLATTVGQITDIEGETDMDVMDLIDKVDDWEKKTEFKELKEDVRKNLIGVITEGINLDKDVQSEFIEFTLNDEKAKILKKVSPNPFVSDTTPKTPQIIIPEVTKKWAKKPGNNFKEKSQLKKPCNYVQFLKWIEQQKSFGLMNSTGMFLRLQLPDGTTATTSWTAVG